MTALTRNGALSVIQHKVLVLILAFWMGGSLFLDLVLMPSLYGAGMMTEANFSSVAYGLFWLFNRLELLCAALVLTAVLAQFHTRSQGSSPIVVALASWLFVGVCLCTYYLTPQMSALGLPLELFETGTLSNVVPAAMNSLHFGYWFLEVLKFSAGGWLLLREL